MSFRTGKIFQGPGAGSGSGGGGSSVTTISYDMSGLTNIDLTGQTGELIINITSGSAAQNLNSFSNYAAVTKITLRPAAGIVLTVIDGDPSINLSAPTLDVNGTLDGFLELTKRSASFYQTNYLDQYN